MNIGIADGGTSKRVVLKCGGPAIAGQRHEAISRVVLAGNLNHGSRGITPKQKGEISGI